MIIRLANVVYWSALAVSAFMIFMVGVTAVLGTGNGPIQFAVAVLAVLIWLAGRAVLYVFADR
jgi:hypothetical protein